MIPRFAYVAPSPDTLYIDPAIPTAQAKEIEELVTQNFGSSKTIRLPIRFRQEHSVRTVEIPGLLTFRVLVTGNTISQDVADFLYPWLFNPVQGRALDVRYKGAGREPIHYVGTNAISAEFRMEKPAGGR